jgi:hypothetical protein
MQIESYRTRLEEFEQKLKEIRGTGLLYRADELCCEIGIGDLEPRVVADRLWEGLQH